MLEEARDAALRRDQAQAQQVKEAQSKLVDEAR